MSPNSDSRLETRDLNKVPFLILFTNYIYATASDALYTLKGLSPIRSESTSRTPVQSQSSQTIDLNVAAPEFSPVITPQQATPVQMVNHPFQPLEGQSSLQSKQFDAWTTIAQAIIQCVHLPVGQKYTQVCRTLQENFGQPHMIIEAHMKRLKVIQMRKADAPSLMEFVGKLEDTRGVLASRADNEVVLVMQMRKLSEEGLKKKVVDRARDLIVHEGRAEYADFVEFVRRVAGRINNKYRQELRSSFASERDRRESSKGKSEHQPTITTLASASDRTRKSTKTLPRASQKCAHCSGLHGVWRCRAFRGAPLSERLGTFRQHKL